ncbi:MAG: hypothetical protein U0838_17055 [Chloroflexota bacterium]
MRRRAARAPWSITLAVTAPRQAGRYALKIDMRDTGRTVLPKAQRVAIPAAQVRVLGDRSVSVQLASGPDGSGAVIKVTNTGRVAIPAAPADADDATADPDDAASRTVVSVTAASSSSLNAPMLVFLAARR